MRKLLLSVLILFGIGVVTLGGAFLFREELARFAAGRFMADGALTLTRLEGLQVARTQLTVAELEFLLNESGQRLQIDGLDIKYRVTSLRAAPELESVAIASMRLLANAAQQGPDAAQRAGAGQDDDAADGGTRLSAVLRLLREFPLAQVTIAELSIPQHSMPLALSLQRGSGRLDAQLESGPLRLQAGFAQADAAAEARIEIGLARATANVGEFTLRLNPANDAYALTGNGSLDVPDLNALLDALAQAPLAVPLRSARVEWDLSGSIADDLSGSAFSTPQDFVLGFAAASTVTLPAGLAADTGEITLLATERVELGVTTGAGMSLRSGRLPLKLTTAINGQAASVDGLVTLQDCALSAEPRCTASFSGNAAFGTYSLTGSLDAQSAGTGSYRIATRGLALGGISEWLPAFDLDLSLESAAGILRFSTPVTLRNTPVAPALALEGTYELAARVARVSATLPEVAFMEEGGALSSWFSAWPYAFDILTGSAAAEADLVWQAGTLSGQVTASLRDLGGFYGDFFFRDLDTALQAELDTGGALPFHTPPLTLTVAGLDVGVPMENLRLDFSVDSAGVIHIAEFSAELLDGTLSGSAFSYDRRRERNDILVRFAGLEIARMLDLIEYKGVEANGAVSGEIPLTLTPNGVEVANGVLAAEAPGGSIRYVAAATAGETGNPGLDLMNQALSNYRFDSLTSGIEYTPDGELLLEMKLTGHNPDMDTDQRINLNLNVSDNIPALLESLQAARKIEDFLAEQYQ